MIFRKTTIAALYFADAAASLLVAEKEISEFGIYVKGMPEYTLEEVAKHDSIEKRVWVAYRHGVYDITDFIYEHPGKKCVIFFLFVIC